MTAHSGPAQSSSSSESTGDGDSLSNASSRVDIDVDLVSLADLTSRQGEREAVIAECGGKAANLARVAALGLAVPPGFVVTRSVWQRGEIALSELHARLVELLAILPGSGPVVVRSSAIGEDSDQAAFAGLLTSELNVSPEPDAVIAAIRKCWSSYDAPRVAAYQAARGVQLAGMAVLVQRQVPASWAGVSFTRSNNEILVEYCAGLGERLVSGEISPGRTLIRHDANGATNFELLAPWHDSHQAQPSARVMQDLADAAAKIEAHFGGPQDIEWASDASDQLFVVQARPITAALPHQSTVRDDNDAPRELWSNVNVNENYPEPITPVLGSIAELGYYHYFRGLGELLGMSSRRIATVEAPLRRIVGLQGARLYYNLTNIHCVLRAAPLGDWLARAFDQFVGVHDEALPELAHTQATQSQPTQSQVQAQAHAEQSQHPSETPPDYAARSNKPRLRSWWSRLRDSYEVVSICWRAWRTLGRLETHVSRFEQRVDSFAAAAHPDRLAPASLEQLGGLVAEFIRIRSGAWRDAAVADAASMATYALLKQVLSREFPSADQSALHNSLLKGQRDLVSTRPATELSRIAAAIRAEPHWRAWLSSAAGDTDASDNTDANDDAWSRALKQLHTRPELAPLARMFDDWLSNWGFRHSGELLLTRPSYQEQPEHALRLLHTYASATLDSESQLARHEAERCAETSRIMAALGTRRFSFRLPLLRWRVSVPWLAKSAVVARLLSATQRSIAFRERARLKQALLYTRLRRVLLALGQHLEAAGTFTASDDVFFLTIHELAALVGAPSSVSSPRASVDTSPKSEAERQASLGAIRELIQKRRQEHATASDLELPSRFHLQRGASAESLGVTSAAHQNAVSPETRNTTRSSRHDENEVRTLRGVSVCGGRATGPSAVLLDLAESARLVPGSILVTRQTDPGWAPVFPLIRGLVLERGGMLSHGAILAREYGLPSIVAAAQATRVVPAGRSITVDGDRGTVAWQDEMQSDE